MSGVSDYSTTASSNTPAGTESIRSGDGQIRQMKADIAAYTRVGADLASASTLDLDSVDALELAVTGTTTVTAVTLTEGHVRTVRATGAFQLTASSSLIVNGSTSVNYTTTAGDLLKFIGYGSSVVRVWVIGNAGFLRGLMGLTGADGSIIRVTGAATAVMQTILGTVSQSGGTPTGALFEYGSNSNGSYIRFPDKTQVCWRSLSSDSFSISNSYGSLYAGDPSTWTFPAAFAAAPAGFSHLIWGSGRSWGSVYATTTTTLQYFGVDVASRSSGTTSVVNQGAIGRWF